MLIDDTSFLTIHIYSICVVQLYANNQIWMAKHFGVFIRQLCFCSFLRLSWLFLHWTCSPINLCLPQSKTKTSIEAIKPTDMERKHTLQTDNVVMISREIRRTQHQIFGNWWTEPAMTKYECGRDERRENQKNQR